MPTSPKETPALSALSFTKEKVDGLNGLTEVLFTAQEREGEPRPFPPFRVIANKFGIRMEGKSYTLYSVADLEEYAAVISLAMREHLALKPKIEITNQLPQG